VGHGTGVLCRNRGEFGGLGGNVAKHRSGLPTGLVDHLLELADPTLAELPSSRCLLSARTPAVDVLLVGARLFGARTCLVFRSHLITWNWGEDWLPSSSGVANATPGVSEMPARGRPRPSDGPVRVGRRNEPADRRRSFAWPRCGADAPSGYENGWRAIGIGVRERRSYAISAAPTIPALFRNDARAIGVLIVR